MNQFGIARVKVVSPDVHVGAPMKNVEEIYKTVNNKSDAFDLIAFPELSVTGYTCADLFHQSTLQDSAEMAVQHICRCNPHPLIMVGSPVPINGKLYNCAIVISYGKVIGIVPKQYLPNYNEFYEPRWFSAADGSEPKTITFANENVPFGIDLLFRGEGSHGAKFTVCAEICEDGWMPVTPFSLACMAGATVGVNLSASPEKVGTEEYRRDMVTRANSARCMAGYLYASSGPKESTADSVFSGHCLIAENGNILAESAHIGDGTLNFKGREAIADLDIDRIIHDRITQGTFSQGAKRFKLMYRFIDYSMNLCNLPNENRTIRKIAATPFVPGDPKTLHKRCASVFDIQCAAVGKRLERLGFPDVNLGVSGGLDSTHMLLVAVKTLEAYKHPPTKLHCLTMPGFGTTDKTNSIAKRLMKNLGVQWDEIDIRPLCLQTFLDINHKPFGIDLEPLAKQARLDAVRTELPFTQLMVEGFMDMLRKVGASKRKDLVFENTQADIRTLLLFRKGTGFTLGTGDMSELALGWCTYRADHMSHYNANCGIPKTLIRFMVEYVANNYYPKGELQDAMLESAGMAISPELLPHDDGEIAQFTEKMVGPYVLNDFFMLNLIRYGFSPRKVLYLAANSDLAKMYDKAEIRSTLISFVRRFFDQQFKRECVPNGPKVGTMSLSPRGDWRCPPDADPEAWLNSLETV